MTINYQGQGGGIPRVTAKIFAENALTDDVTVFGSTLAGSTVKSKDISLIQNNAYSSGWRNAVISNKNYPLLADMNAVLLTATQQIAGVLQHGICEYDSSTKYYTYDLVNQNGIIYISTQDNHSGHTPSNSSSYWAVFYDPDTFVQKAGDTMTGTLTFSGTNGAGSNKSCILVTQEWDMTSATTPSSNIYAGNIYIKDSQNNKAFRQYHRYSNDGISAYVWELTNYDSNSNSITKSMVYRAYKDDTSNLTMDGSLIVKNSSGGNAQGLFLKNTALDWTTTPASNKYSPYIQFTDNNDGVCGDMWLRQGSNGSNRLNLRVYNASGTAAIMYCEIDTSGVSNLKIPGAVNFDTVNSSSSTTGIMIGNISDLAITTGGADSNPSSTKYCADTIIRDSNNFDLFRSYYGYSASGNGSYSLRVRNQSTGTTKEGTFIFTCKRDGTAYLTLPTTMPAGDNSTKAATTAYADRAANIPNWTTRTDLSSSYSGTFLQATSNGYLYINTDGDNYWEYQWGVVFKKTQNGTEYIYVAKSTVPNSGRDGVVLCLPIPKDYYYKVSRVAYENNAWVAKSGNIGIQQIYFVSSIGG